MWKLKNGVLLTGIPCATMGVLTNFMYLYSSADVKISTFFVEKKGDEDVDHEMDL